MPLTVPSRPSCLRPSPPTPPACYGVHSCSGSSPSSMTSSGPPSSLQGYSCPPSRRRPFRFLAVQFFDVLSFNDPALLPISDSYSQGHTCALVVTIDCALQCSPGPPLGARDAKFPAHLLRAVCVPPTCKRSKVITSGWGLWELCRSRGWSPQAGTSVLR